MGGKDNVKDIITSIMGGKDSVKDTITSNFNDKLWDDKVLEGKRKLGYYKKVIKPTLDNENDIFVLTSTKK